MSEPMKAVQVNIRWTFEEEATIVAAAEALGLATSAFIELSLYQASVDLGMLLLDGAAPRLKPGYSWPYTPMRSEGESSRSRQTVYVPAAVYPTIVTAAWAVHLSVPLFAIGSTLRQVAFLKLANEKWQRVDAQRFNPKLASIRLPYDFDEVAKSARS